MRLPRTLAVLTSALGLMCATTATATAAELTPVTDFGANPGALAMHSYVPDGLPAGAPLVVALHGCTQNADDYFTHSGWREHADRFGFAVVLAEQPAANNARQCFNWFEPADSDRDSGEAASIRQMVAYAHDTYGTDSGRTFVTGLSAGGGMTANLLADYPDVFAGGAVNAGPPAKCATTLPAALSCMSSDQGKTPQQWGDLVRGSHPGHTGAWPRVAIWQGTADTTVAPVNATELRDQWTDVHGLPQTPTGSEQLPGGTTRTSYSDQVVEFSVDGMGHGLAVDPDAGCGVAGTYYLDTICSTHHTAVLWGLAE